MLTPIDALEVIKTKTTERHNLNKLLSSTVGTTFVNMVSVTDVSLAATHKKDGIIVKKVVKSTILVANNLKASTNLYQNKVLRTMDQSPNHDDKDFVFSGSNYIRQEGDAYSVLTLRSQTLYKYLEAFPQDTQGVQYIKIENGNASAITKAHLAELLTPSAAKKLFEASTKNVYNVKNDIHHKAVYRAYKVASIHSLTMNGETYIGEFYAD